MPIRVAIVDDHALARAGFRHMFLPHPEIEVIADSAESDGENAAYEVTLDGLPLQRGEHRRIDGDPTAIDVYPLPDAIETAETAENIENTGENDNADDAAIVRISASAHDGAKITALRLHK